MLPADETPRAESPVDERGGVAIDGAPGWKYRPFEAPPGAEALTVTAEREDGLTITFTVPAYVSRGDELGDVARIVIRARERTERAEGLGA
jgi:hypothetical protein